MKRTFILFFLTLGSFSITAQDFQEKHTTRQRQLWTLVHGEIRCHQREKK